MQYETLDDILGEDVFDTRDFREFIEDLNERAEDPEDTLDADEAADWREGMAFAKELEEAAPDYLYGETVIADRYFTEYAQELAEDVGALDNNNEWPTRCIDWKLATEELQMDYTPVECRGRTFWVQ